MTYQTQGAPAAPLPPTLPETGFVRLPQIIGDDKQPGVFPVSKSTWWEGVRTGRYPAPVKIAPRCTAWRAEDIRKLIESAGGEANG